MPTTSTSCPLLLALGVFAGFGFGVIYATTDRAELRREIMVLEAKQRGGEQACRREGPLLQIDSLNRAAQFCEACDRLLRAIGPGHAQGHHDLPDIQPIPLRAAVPARPVQCATGSTP